MREPVDRFQARLDALRAVSRSLARPVGLVDALRSVTAELARVVDVTMCFFGFYDAAGQNVKVIWQQHDGVELPGGQFPLGNGFTSQVIRNRQAVVIQDWSQEGPHVQVQYATDRPELPQSTITVPVMFDDRVLGVLSVQSYQSRAFDDDDLKLVQVIGDLLAAMLAGGRDAGVELGAAEASTSDLETVFASTSDALVVVDNNARVVKLNQAARALLSAADDSLILGWPADEPQRSRWPLGSQTVANAVRPILGYIKRGQSPVPEVTFSVPPRTIRCAGSLLVDKTVPFGGVLMFHEVLASATP